LYHTRTRQYHPSIGTFLSRDVIEHVSGKGHLYCYVDNNPISFVDPTGMVPGVAGKMDVSLVDCNDEHKKLAEGPCCTDVIVHYTPTAADKTMFAKISIEVEARTQRWFNPSLLWGTWGAHRDEPWHVDKAVDKQTDWIPTRPYLPATWTDYPSIGNYDPNPCGGAGAIIKSIQDFKAVAEGETAGGTRMFLGVVYVRVHCSRRVAAFDEGAR